MGLATYRSCSFSEKRAVLRAFWSGQFGGPAKINEAAREYAPYAVASITIITIELGVIATLLVLLASVWAWVGTAAFVLSAWSLWWSLTCRRRVLSLVVTAT